MNHSDEDAAAASLAKDDYLVAVKILLRDGDKLLIIKDQWDEWDLPGGRIRKDQFETSLDLILREKIDVEIGEDIEYELGDIKTTFRVEREEIGRKGALVRIFAVGYEAKYKSGEIKLGEYGQTYEWIDIKSVNLEDYRTESGWIPQLKDYIESQK